MKKILKITGLCRCNTCEAGFAVTGQKQNNSSSLRQTLPGNGEEFVYKLKVYLPSSTTETETETETESKISKMFSNYLTDEQINSLSGGSNSTAPFRVESYFDVPIKFEILRAGAEQNINYHPMGQPTINLNLNQD